jgi:transposase
MSLALQLFLPFPNSCQGTSPHQQGRGTKMTEHCYCGIDVAKECLDVQVLPHRQRFSVDNNATGWAELIARLHAADRRSRDIIVAVMRKMITTLNAMVRDNAAWQPRAA